MAALQVVVDGSNIATEGRSTPSLAQLDEAVREFLVEHPEAIVTVVVDASFAHRIDPSELALYEEAELAGELVSPPAGAIGRGDAFLLRIADKTGAMVLSNDSFQEFHGEHEWLFEKGRLIGGKPVPGVGWIFTPRTPVRGPKSREAVKEAKRQKRSDGGASSATPGLDLAGERAKASGRGKRTVERAIAVAIEEAVAPSPRRRRRRKTGAPPAEPVNDPLSFITFIAAHPLGSEVAGIVDRFASHGAFVMVDTARCYVPLSAMGSPPPKSAREVFARGEEVTFVIQALDPQRRGIELALPPFAQVAGAPTPETIEAEISRRVGDEVVSSAPPAVSGPARRARSPKAAVPRDASAVPHEVEISGPAPAAPRAKRVGDAARLAPAAGRAAKAPAKAAPAKAAPAKAAPAKAARAATPRAKAAPAGATTGKQPQAAKGATEAPVTVAPAKTKPTAPPKAATAPAKPTAKPTAVTKAARAAKVPAKAVPAKTAARAKSAAPAKAAPARAKSTAPAKPGSAAPARPTAKAVATKRPRGAKAASGAKAAPRAAAGPTAETVGRTAAAAKGASPPKAALRGRPTPNAATTGRAAKGVAPSKAAPSKTSRRAR